MSYATVAVLVFVTLIQGVPASAQAITPDYVMNMARSLPADPGEGGGSTVEGVDANKNGIRDDVEIWISQTFPDDAVARAGALQIGVAMQQLFASGEPIDSSAESHLRLQIRNAIECVLASLDDKAQETIFGSMQGVIMNTPARTAFIEKHEQAYPEPEVTEITAPSVDACTIKIDLLKKEKAQ